MTALRPVLMIVDDDPSITDTLHFVLSKHFEVCVAESHAQVRSLLQQLDAPPAPMRIRELSLELTCLASPSTLRLAPPES